MLVITKNCYNFYPRPSEYTKDLHSNGCIYNSQCDTADSNGVHIINNAFHHNVISILVNINIVFLKDNLLIGNKRNGVFCFENYEEIIKNGNRLIEYSITCLKQVPKKILSMKIQIIQLCSCLFFDLKVAPTVSAIFGILTFQLTQATINSNIPCLQTPLVPAVKYTRLYLSQKNHNLTPLSK